MRPIEGQGRAQVAGPTRAVGDARGLIPIALTTTRGRRGPVREGEGRVLPRAESGGRTPRGKRGDGGFPPPHPPLTVDAPAPGVAPIALVPRWQPLTASP